MRNLKTICFFLFVLTSIECRAMTYIEGMPFYGVPTNTGRLDLGIQRDISEGYYFQRSKVSIETSISENYDIGGTVARAQTENLDWLEPSIVVRKRHSWNVLGISPSAKVQQNLDNKYPQIGGSLFLYLFSGVIKFLTLDYSTVQPITWSDELINRGVHSDTLSLYGHIAPTKKTMEVVVNASAGKVKQEGERVLGRKLESGMRIGFGLPVVNLKLGAFIERDIWYPQEAEFENSFVRRVSLTGPYIGGVLGDSNGLFALHCFARYGIGDKSSDLKRTWSSEMILDLGTRERHYLRIGMTTFHGLGETSVPSISKTLLLQIRSVL